MESVLIVAFGTRGDVEPLLLLGQELARLMVVRFITHEAYARVLDFSAVSLICVQSDPLRPPDPSCAASVCEEYEPVAASIAKELPDLLVFNLFSMGAWHCAERFCVRCVAVSPCLIPYEHPAAFPATFAARFPRLYSRLLAAPPDRLGWRDMTHWCEPCPCVLVACAVGTP